MKFTHPEAVESLVWQFRLSEFPRGENRARINSLFQGNPPYSETEVNEDNIATNVNFLRPTKLAHDARRQFNNAFLAPDPLFQVNVDHGGAHHRQEWSMKITAELSRIMKTSLPYVETRRSQFALNVLHGIAPVTWKDRYAWCPQSRGVEDIFVPSNTLLDMSNLPFYAEYVQYTSQQLYQLTHGPIRDAGWNMDVVMGAIKWVDQQASTLMSASWPEVWSPEKMEERIKQDGGLYASDALPTIDCFKFYYWSDDGKKAGWRLKIILDAWGSTGFGGAGGVTPSKSAPKNNKTMGREGFAKSKFLYDSELRKNPVFASNRNQIIHWQFADGSCVAPFRYHSVRSLGFLLYNICHLQNRVQCKFNDAVFESLMQYFRVGNMGDAERALKVDLTDKRALPDGLQFVPAAERWQINGPMVEALMQQNRAMMDENSAGYISDNDFDRNPDETATRTMAKVNSSAALVSGMLNQAYTYQKFQYDEICRRFCIPNSKDPDVRRFRLNCLRSGIPEDALMVEKWDIVPTRVIGGGNKMLQQAMSDKIMTLYWPKLDPSAQREALQLGLAVTTDDYDLARRWVPEQPQVSNSAHDAQLAAGVLIAALPMDFKQGVNHEEYAVELMKAMATKIKQIEADGGTADNDAISGLQNIAGETLDGKKLPNNGITHHIDIFAQEAQLPHFKGNAADQKAAKQKLKGYTDGLAQLMNMVKQIATNSAKQKQAQMQQQQAGSGVTPEAQAKIASATILAQNKAKLNEQSHAQKTAQRQITFEQKTQQSQQQHHLDMVKQVQEMHLKTLMHE